MSDYINCKTFKVSISKHDAEWDKKPDEFKINDPDNLMVIPDCELKYKKWNDTENIVEEMNQVEKAAVNKVEADALAQAQEDAKDIEKTNTLVKALALVLLDEINVLRKKANLAERTVTQLKTAVKNKYDTL